MLDNSSCQQQPRFVKYATETKFVPHQEHLLWTPPERELLASVTPEAQRQLIEKMKRHDASLFLDSSRQEQVVYEQKAEAIRPERVATAVFSEAQRAHGRSSGDENSDTFADTYIVNQKADRVDEEEAVSPATAAAVLQPLQAAESVLLDDSTTDDTKETTEFPETQYDENLAPWYTLAGPEDSTLLFESRFESGNLRSSTRIAEREYDLRLHYDLFTKAHTQWFYFSVRNMRKGQIYKFNIVNLLKPDSLFNTGLKPVVYSRKAADIESKGWHRDGFDVCYYLNHFRREANEYLASLESRPADVQALFSREKLCTSLGGNQLDVLTITEPSKDPNASAFRKGLVLTARVHPGESNASWMMHGAIEWLLDPRNESARQFRQEYVIKVVPMVNVDGVINGNYRSSLAGLDLNRGWMLPCKNTTPEVYHLKQMMQQFIQERDVYMYIDFHGHSRKQNVFFYGCTNHNVRVQRLQLKLFPKIAAAVGKNCFCFKDCSFNLASDKDTTARVVSFRELRIQYSYTMEASFAGPSIGEHAGSHFSQSDFMHVGEQLCLSILSFTKNKKLRQKHYSELEEMFPPKQQQSKSKPSSPREEAEVTADEMEQEQYVANGALPMVSVAQLTVHVPTAGAEEGADGITANRSQKQKKSTLKKPASKKQTKAVDKAIQVGNPCDDVISKTVDASTRTTSTVAQNLPDHQDEDTTAKALFSSRLLSRSALIFCAAAAAAAATCYWAFPKIVKLHR